MKAFRAVVVGSSAGGLRALEAVLSRLPKDFPWPFAIVQHLSPDSSGTLASVLSEKIKLKVKEADDKEPVVGGTVYVAPPNYHLLLEKNGTFSLSVDEKENFSRPSIDVLFESAADVYGDSLIGIILTGASADGAAGLKKISESGGFTIIQDPETAESKLMPESAIKMIRPDHVLPLEKIGPLLCALSEAPERTVHG